ncbi:hypothetical protein WCLP8_3270019 [uncultured Gammaproteobacteria bacterium]
MIEKPFRPSLYRRRLNMVNAAPSLRVRPMLCALGVLKPRTEGAPATTKCDEGTPTMAESQLSHDCTLPYPIVNNKGESRVGKSMAGNMRPLGHSAGEPK